MTWTASAAYVLADPNRNNTRMLEQWLGIGKANNVQAIKASLDKTIGLPWVNTLAADRDGNVLYADASVVPHMGAQKFGNGCLLLQAALLFDGSRSSCGWGQDANAPAGIYSPANGPWAIRTDYVGNSNDSYWLNNPKALVERAGAARLFSAVWPRRGRATPAHADRLPPVRGTGKDEEDRPRPTCRRWPSRTACMRPSWCCPNCCRPAPPVRDAVLLPGLHRAVRLGPPRECRQPGRGLVPRILEQRRRDSQQVGGALQSGRSGEYADMASPRPPCRPCSPH